MNKSNRNLIKLVGLTSDVLKHTYALFFQGTMKVRLTSTKSDSHNASGEQDRREVQRI